MSRHMPEHVSEHVSKHMSKTRLNERTLNYVFCAVFVFELLVKIVAFGPAQYSPRRRPPPPAIVAKTVPVKSRL